MESIHDYYDMVERLVKPGADILKTLSDDGMHYLHMAIGMAGEAGELLGAIDTAFSNDGALDMENVLEEVGDYRFYFTGFVNTFPGAIDGVAACEVGNLGFELPKKSIPYGACDAFTTFTVIRLNVYTSDFLDLIKKVIVYNDDRVTTKQLFELLAKIQKVLEIICIRSGFSELDVMEANYDKLMRKRYKSGVYSDEQAQERADKVT